MFMAASRHTNDIEMHEEPGAATGGMETQDRALTASIGRPCSSS